jgi:DNA-binding transcriptional LysR family regulator
VAQEAIQMQTIVNLVSGGIGLAWVPHSVMQFKRAGVVYRQAQEFKGPGRGRVALPACETSLVWPAHAMHPALARFVEFVRERTHKRG